MATSVNEGGEHMDGSKEVDQWLGTEAWRIAERLHAILCKRSHEMDQCWGLNSPYDLNQPRLSSIQRDYLTRAERLVAVVGDQADAVIDALWPGGR